MNDEQLLRYSRHILLDELGVEGQEKLLSSRALVIGAGGLGSPAVLYLASAGVGCITVVDHDTVDLTNLQRQIAHGQDRIGRPKAESAIESAGRLNPEIELHAVVARADAQALARWVQDADVVLDCSDNYETRQAVNAACVAARRPLVSAAAVGFDGQISVWDTRGNGPCYACVFSPQDAPPEVRCATMGVFAPLVGLMGSWQVAEALKVLTGLGETLSGRLMMVDARHFEFQNIQIGRDPACSVCGGRHGE
jgi:molybdopterin/thiamine biosynthesis adenylyltransferase